MRNLRKVFLSKRLKKYIKDKEKYLGYKCMAVHPDGKGRYLYGVFDDGTPDKLIVTLGYKELRLISNDDFFPMDFAGGTF